MSAIGPVLATETPPQGGNSSVTIQITAEGRFVHKIAPWEEREREVAVLALLRGGDPRLRAPQVVDHDADATVYTELPGRNLAEAMAQAEGDTARRQRLAAAFGEALRTIHSWQPVPCTIDEGWLDRAALRAHEVAAPYAGGAIDDPASPWRGTKAVDLAIWMTAQRSDVRLDPAFCHGDWCLPNAMVEDDRATGAVDWSGGGWGDRRYDLATALWSLRFNTPDDPAQETYLQRFLDAYGWPGGVAPLRFFEALYILS